MNWALPQEPDGERAGHRLRLPDARDLFRRRPHARAATDEQPENAQGTVAVCLTLAILSSASAGARCG